MPAVTMSGMTGAPRSLDDALYLTHMPSTPLTSKLNTGETVYQETHTYKVGREGDPVESATPDNAPPSPAGGKNPEYEVTCRVGFFESMPRVGKFAKHKRVVGQTTATAPKRNPGANAPHLAMARAQHLVRIKQGMEKRLLSDSDSAAETATEAAKYRGLGSWINNSAQTDNPVNTNVRTPSAQIYTGTTADLSETAMNLLLQRRYEATGVAPELFGVLGSALKAQVATYNRRVPTVANYETVIRYPAGTAKTVMSGVDIFEGDFGTVEFMLDFWVPSTKRGYILDMAHPQRHAFGPGMEEEELGKDGGGDSKVIRAMYAIHPGDPRAHIKIKPSDE